MTRREMILTAALTFAGTAVAWFALQQLSEMVGVWLADVASAALFPVFGAVIWRLSGAPVRSTVLWIAPTFGVFYAAMTLGSGLLGLLVVWAAMAWTILMVFSPRLASWWIDRTR